MQLDYQLVTYGGNYLYKIEMLKKLNTKTINDILGCMKNNLVPLKCRLIMIKVSNFKFMFQHFADVGNENSVIFKCFKNSHLEICNANISPYNCFSAQLLSANFMPPSSFKEKISHFNYFDS